MKVVYSLVFFLILMGGCASSPQTSENTINITINEYSEHLMHYFENKNDTIIYETISVYRNNDNIGMLDMVDSIIIFFFYGIKNDDIVRYNNFRRIVTDNKIERLINIFNIIDETDITAYLEDEDASPELNDVYWTLYFSSGNTKYIDYLLKIVMDYNNETENANYYLAAGSAMWSLSSNIQTFPSVRDYVQNNDILSNNIKEYILNNDPGKIQADIIQFINEQRQKGIW